MKLKGTKTAENWLKSFAGESQANRRYTYYAKVARKQGYIQIADIFEETADQESMHAKRFFSFLNEDKELQGEMLGITAEYPVALYEETLDNLKAAAAGENEEWTDLYPEFGKIAREEGFGAIAAAFDKIAEVEARHEKRYNKLIENNIFVRNLLHSDLLINTLRISIGTKEQMNIVVDVLKKVKSWS